LGNPGSTLKVADKNFFKQGIPEYIPQNLNPAFELREYQKEAIGRLVYILFKVRRQKPAYTTSLSYGDWQRQNADYGCCNFVSL